MFLDDNEDDENNEDNTDRHENASDFDEEDYEQDEDDGDSNVEDEDSDRLSEDYADETIQKHKRHSLRKNPNNKKNSYTSTVSRDRSRKRRHSTASIDLKSRKSRRTRLKVNYNEDIEDYTASGESSLDSGDDANQIIGVSSRGRVRKAASKYVDFVES